jgi:hypothetical protein
MMNKLHAAAAFGPMDKAGQIGEGLARKDCF